MNIALLILLLVLLLNFATVAINIKLYTEIMKDKNQDRRQKGGN